MFEESREFNHFHRRSQFVSPYFSKEGTLLTGNRTQYEQLSHRSLFKQPRKQSPASPFRPPGSTNILLPVRPSPEGVHLPQLTPSISMSKSHPSYNPSSGALSLSKEDTQLFLPHHPIRAHPHPAGAQEQRTSEHVHTAQVCHH